MRDFFFAEESPRPAALLRMALCTLLLVEAAVRWPSAIELYSSAGRPIPVFPGTLFEPPNPNAAATVAMHTALLFALASAAAGWKTRSSLIAAAVLSTWLGLLDLPGTYKKYTVISLHLVVLLSLTNSGGAWSIDSWRRRKEERRTRNADAGIPRSSFLLPRSPLWPRRLMQIFLCSVYLGAAVTKIRMPDFASGEMVEFALLGDEFGGRLAGHWLVRHPALLTAASMGTILFEVVFPFLVWVERLRRPMLLVAAVFHLTLQATMHLGLFSWVMLIALLAFVRDDDLSVLAPRHETARPVDADDVSASPTVAPAASPFGAVASWLAWLSSAGLIAALGLFAQRKSDCYGVFHGEPAGGRAEVVQELVDDVLIAQAPSYSDYVHAMELGTHISNGRALGGGRQFRRGEIVRAAVRFVHRHPPLTLDWLLIAPDGREAARLTRRLDASVSHATAGFEITPDAPPGRYRVILQTDGHEAIERQFELLETE